MTHHGHGIALFSGGLDSTLAVLLILQQNIKVTALNFMTHFECDFADKSSSLHDPYPLAEQFGFEIKVIHLGENFIDIVRNPKYGHGKNMNPCIDCRIFMLREAKRFMEMVDADFVFTGEILGQRPMSQHRPQLATIEQEADIAGRLVRPLSAKLMTPTEPEKSGLLDRNKLEGISGRSRKRQIELANQFGLEDFPNPAAGCLLTDVNYSRRLRDLFDHRAPVDFNDVNLLKIGRHFRINDRTKIIVGRHEEENEKIERYRKEGQWIFEAKDTGSPLTLLDGDLTDDTIRLAAGITARYCDAKRQAEVTITYFNGTMEHTLTVPPYDDEVLKTYLI